MCAELMLRKNLGCGKFSALWINEEKTSHENVSQTYEDRKVMVAKNKRKIELDRYSDGSKFSEKNYFFVVFPKLR